MLYCKGRRGVMPLPNLVLMLPFMLLHLVLSRIKQATRDRGESQSDRVAPSVWLGRYPFSRRLFRSECEGEVDLCAELPRPGFLRVKQYVLEFRFDAFQLLLRWLPRRLPALP